MAPAKWQYGLEADAAAAQKEAGEIFGVENIAKPVARTAKSGIIHGDRPNPIRVPLTVGRAFGILELCERTFAI
jgi:hypothetical protein